MPGGSTSWNGDSTRATPAISTSTGTPPSALEGKVLLPIPGRAYGETLAAGEIALHFDAAAGALDLRYFDHRLPLRPQDYLTVLAPLVGNRSAFAQAISVIDETNLAAPQHSLHEMAIAMKQVLAAAAAEPATLAAITATVDRYAGTAGDAERPLTDVFTGAGIDACERGIALDRALAHLPVAILRAER